MSTLNVADQQRLVAMRGHLRTQFERANPVLFTGAGFSRGAKNMLKKPIPSVKELRADLWRLCFGDEPMEDDNSLQDLFQMARNQHRKELTSSMTAAFTVDTESIPDWYRAIFSLPWHRCYTLNIDNLATAVNRAFHLPRPIKVSSATSRSFQRTVVNEVDNLHVIHLNGSLEDLPDHVTFSMPQYAERLVHDDPWYHSVISDLLSRPIVFIGTTLDEPPLWQYLEKRRSRGGRAAKEFRPKSYLFSPSLSKSRQSCLIDYNISYYSLTGEAFATEVITQLSDANTLGHTFLRESSQQGNIVGDIGDVASLAILPSEKTEFLLGAEPRWSDIQTGRAIDRSVDEDIARDANRLLHQTGMKGILILTGTAGTGKGTSLKRIALRLSADGHRVGWVDPTLDVPPSAIRKLMRTKGGPRVLAIDEADIYGAELAGLVRDIATGPDYPLVILAIRSGRVDRALNPTQLSDIPRTEAVMPYLTDPEIELLLDVLTREERLGVLRNRPREAQIQVFREKCGRQLLVAMIEATSGLPFEQKIKGEYSELEAEMKRIYALVAVASTFRFYLTKQDLILAVGEATNEVLNAIQKLVDRQIIISNSGQTFRARHRVIADVVFGDLAHNGEISEVICGLARSAAMQLGQTRATSNRHHRLVVRLTNHELLKTTIGFDEARNLYGDLESLLSFEHNYWLQRGSLEVEWGDLHRAENFLSQARQIDPLDMNVQTEYGYLLFRKALANPAGAHAREFVKEALDILHANIAIRGSKDPHSYHVLGANMLDWIERGIAVLSEQKAEMENLIRIVNDGSQKHPQNDRLQTLRQKLNDAYLSMAVS